MLNDPPPAPGARGRVVMIVDTDVHGDSRVQKAARAAAESGWDVVLLGRAGGREVERFSIGGAEVRLLPTPPSTPGSAGSARPGPSRRSQLQGAMKRAVKGRWFIRLADRTYTAFWTRIMGDRAWRRLEPHLWDFERSYGPVIDELRPDIIHANDFRMIGVGARAAQRARARGHAVGLIWDAHEYLPGIKPWRDNAHWLPAHCAYEREYVPFADAAITVSEALADLLQTSHGLAERPRVVLNAPDVRAGSPGRTKTDLRDQCGIGRETPLICFCGLITPVRGVDVMIEALPALPGVHVALVSIPPGQPVAPYPASLVQRAAELGVAERVHLLPYVAYDDVVSYLSTADAAVSPLLHLGNHEIALSNKFFDYSHARLPLIVSDVKTMAETVRRTGQGEVFRAGDVADYTRAVGAVLADPARYRAAYERPGLLAGWTWQAQARVLDEVYRRVRPDRSPAVTPAEPARP